VSERQEDMLDLTVAVAGYRGLHESLTGSYLDGEILDGNNQYMCSNCNKLVNATKVPGCMPSVVSNALFFKSPLM